MLNTDLASIRSKMEAMNSEQLAKMEENKKYDCIGFCKYVVMENVGCMRIYWHIRNNWRIKRHTWKIK